MENTLVSDVEVDVYPVDDNLWKINATIHYKNFFSNKVSKDICISLEAETENSSLNLQKCRDILLENDVGNIKETLNVPDVSTSL